MLLNISLPNGSRITSIEREEAVELGIDEALIEAAEQEGRRSLISAECKRRIYDKASPETQSNMGLAVGVIGSKTASNRSDDEKAILAGAEAGLGWVQAMRANVGTLAVDPDVDFTDDALWPEPPAAALAVVEMF